MRKHKMGKDIAFLLVVLILVLVVLYSGLQILETTVLRPEQSEDVPVVRKTITRNGIDYYPRQDITTVLIMGIDQFGPVADSGYHQNPGASDLNVLVIFDETNRVCNVLHLNRDTMVKMPALGINGKPAGSRYGQLALSHTYGSGLEDSCANTVQTVSDLLYGIRIDYYVAMNMDAIPILNDGVGGVTVTVTDDFSAVDPTIRMGRMTLRGQQALTFVRTRKDVGDQQNVTRIQRHKEYLENFLLAAKAKQSESLSFVLDLYGQVSPYLVTNCSANAISGMMDRYGDFELNEVVSPEGENVLGEEYMEFYLDEEKLDELILRLFYAPKR
jgi:LCP family protein required for cell wall assembly